MKTTWPSPAESLLLIPTAKEQHVLKGVKDYLTAEGIRFLRVHCGKAKRGKYWLNLAPTGWPDIYLELPAGRKAINPATRLVEVAQVARVAYVETKHPAEGKLSAEQKEFQRDAASAGALYWPVRDVDMMRYYLPPLLEFDFNRR